MKCVLDCVVTYRASALTIPTLSETLIATVIRYGGAVRPLHLLSECPSLELGNIDLLFPALGKRSGIKRSKHEPSVAFVEDDQLAP
jgi:hypothetical protein